MKNSPQARYKAAHVITRCVDFYPGDADILALSRDINFAQFVKTKLREEKETRDHGKADLPDQERGAR